MLLLLLLLITPAQSFDFETCRQALGLESGKLTDASFSASSHAGESSSASKARIRSETNGWCPLSKISSTSYEYIQVDLGNVTVVTLVELQGTFSRKSSEQFADAFRLEYRRHEEHPWIQYKDFSGRYILSGNTNNYIPTIRDLLPSIIARQIRIIPVVPGPVAKHVCMRLELYGCAYQGPMSYTIPQGDQRGYEAQFLDETYDGQIEKGILQDGLGQLTDGIVANADYSSTDSVQGIGQLGYDWIGWKRRSATVNLTFHFPTLRHFTSMRLHTSNLFTRQIYVFHSITIRPCQDAMGQRIEQTLPTDTMNTSARWIDVSLGGEYGLVGRCLQIVLTFHERSQWILLSEVQFDSQPIKMRVMQTSEPKTHLPLFISPSASLMHYGFWLFFAASLLILLTAIVMFIYIQWSSTHRQQTKLCKMNPDFKFDLHYQPIPRRSPMNSSTDDSHTSYGISTCFTSNTDLHRHLVASNTKSTASSNSSPVQVSKIYQPEANSYLTATCQETSHRAPDTYASIEMYMCPVSETSVCTEHSMKSIQGPCGNSLYQSSASANKSSPPPVPTVDDARLIIRERYSTVDGTFGTGYISSPDSSETLTPVLIKSLTTNDDTHTDEFKEEHRLMCALDHPNLIHFYGYTAHYRFALIEHSDLGDLHTYLLRSSTLPINIRLYLITQLSNALTYLESQNILHRDIAARNCLVFPNYELKLTNVAITCEHFRSHYYSIDQCRLPMRWMAPECFADNLFTLQSEVWAFGITLWELMTDCQTLPYAHLHDEEIYRRLKSSGDLLLPKPECLNKELIDLMLECWRPLHERPSFREISSFLKRRLQGLNFI